MLLKNGSPVPWIGMGEIPESQMVWATVEVRMQMVKHSQKLELLLEQRLWVVSVYVILNFVALCVV